MPLVDRPIDPGANERNFVLGGLQALEGITQRLSRCPLEEVLSEIPLAAAKITCASAAALLLEGIGKPLTYPSYETVLEEAQISLPVAEHVRATRYSVNLSLRNGTRLTTALCVPLTHQRGISGLLCVYGGLDSSLGELEEQLLSLLAHQLSQALVNQSLAVKASRREAVLKAVHRIGEEAWNFRDPQQVLQTIAEAALDVLEADFVVLYEYLKSERDVRIPPLCAGPLSAPEVLAQRGAIVPHQSSAVFRLLHERRPVYASDAVRDWQRLGLAKTDERHRSFLAREGVVSSAGVPLVLNDEILGVLFVNYRRPETFGLEEREQIEIFASQAGQAISLARRTKNLAWLAEIGLTLSSAVVLNIDHILALTHLQISRLLEAKNIYIWFYDEDLDQYSQQFSAGVAEELADLPPEKIRKTLAAYVIRRRQPCLVNREVYDDLVRHGEAEQLGRLAKVWLGAPMIAHGRVLGMIAVQDYEDENIYGHDDLRLLATLANQAAVAIDNARLLQSRDKHHFLRAVLERSVEALESDAGVIFVKERASNPRSLSPKLRVDVNYRWPEIQNKSLALGQGFAGKVARDRESDFRNDYQSWGGKAPLFKKPGYQDKIGSLIGAPVIVHGEVEGVIVLTSTPRRRRIYTQSDVELLEHFAEPTTLVIDDAKRRSFQRALIDNSPYAVIGVNSEGKLEIFNAAAEKLLGVQRGEMVGGPAHKIFAKGIFEVIKIHRKMEREGGQTQLASWVRGAEEELIPVLVSAAFLRDERGSLLGSITLLEDLRIESLRDKGKELLVAIDRIDRLQALELNDAIAEEGLRLFNADASCLFTTAGPLFRARACYDSSGKHMTSRDLKGRSLARSSPVIRKILQLDTLSLGKWEASLLPQVRETLLIRIADETATYGILSLESTNVNHFKFVDQRLVRIFAGRCAGALKRRELARRRRRIEDALIRSGGTIAAAQIGTMVVHEIKNSLSNIFWTLRDLKEAPALTGKSKKRLGVIEMEVERLTDLTERLREYSNNKLEPRKKRAFMNDIVRQTLDVLESSIRRKRIVLEADLDPDLDRSAKGGRKRMILVDSGQISQVIINLTLNALKASQEGGKITFTTRLRGEVVEMLVADTGRGIGATQARDLFKNEFRRSPTGRGGLGLLISKLIIENNHSGQLTVQSKAGRGTTVSVQLPVAP